MFEKFFKLWKTGDLLDASFKEVDNMFKLAKDMFEYSINLVIEQAENEEDIYKKDRELNKAEINVRRKILEHLSVNPAQDITPSLVLATIVVDIERIGDYTKNIVELSDKTGDKLQCEYKDIIKELRDRILKNMTITIDALEGKDKENVKIVIEDHVDIASICEKNMERLINEEIKIPTKLSIIYALLFRYVKRISAHTKNVATSIINPYDRIGFKPEN